MDWPLLVKSYASIDGAVGAQQVQGRLSVVTLVRLVHVCLRQHNQARPLPIPLQLDLVTLEEGLLRDGGGELGHIEHLDRGRLAL